MAKAKGQSQRVRRIVLVVDIKTQLAKAQDTLAAAGQPQASATITAAQTNVDTLLLMLQGQIS